MPKTIEELEKELQIKDGEIALMKDAVEKSEANVRAKFEKTLAEMQTNFDKLKADHDLLLAKLPPQEAHNCPWC